MEIVRHSAEIPASARRGVITIGNFDGVHLGHRAVIGTAKRLAGELGAPLAALTFEPHPRRYFQPDAPAFELTPTPGKLRQMALLGVDMVRLVTFDEAVATAPAERFVEDIVVAELEARHVVVGYDFVFGRGRQGNAQLLNELEARHVVVGYDFVFGRARQGNAQLLNELGARLGFGVTAVDPVKLDDGRVYSSTNIRASLRDGDPVAAANLLGRCWEIEGPVMAGDRRGRTIGFPTANLSLDGYLEPAIGVYAVWAGIERPEGTAWRMGCANIGRRPTFGGEAVVIEAHLFDFAEDIYGESLRVALVEYLRPERKFAGVDALKAQIAEDCAAARRLLESLPPDDLRVPAGHTPAAA